MKSFIDLKGENSILKNARKNKDEEVKTNKKTTLKILKIKK